MLLVVYLIFKKLVLRQMSMLAEHFLLPYLCCYIKRLCTQQTLLCRNGYAGVILIGMCEAFAALNYDLLIVRLQDYGFYITVCIYIYIYIYIYIMWMIQHVNKGSLINIS